MKYPVVEYLDQIGSVDVNVQPWQGEEGTVLKREIRMRVPVKGSDLPSPSPSPSPSLLSPIPSHITDFHHDRLCHDHLSSILRTPLHSLSHRCLFHQIPRCLHQRIHGLFRPKLVTLTSRIKSSICVSNLVLLMCHVVIVLSSYPHGMSYHFQTQIDVNSLFDLGSSF